MCGRRHPVTRHQALERHDMMSFERQFEFDFLVVLQGARRLSYFCHVAKWAGALS
jgi:hypothetical protein